MNPIAKEMASYIGQAKMTDEEFLMHYGMPRRSGRYPWGSGKDDYQHSIDFLGRVEKLKKKGWKETPENIRDTFGMSVKEYRQERSLCNDTRRIYKVKRAKALREDGLSNAEIGRQMGINESSVRQLFDAESEARMYQSRNTADFLKKKVDEHKYGMIDVGKEVERELNVSREKLDTALYMLESQGYHIHGGRVPQPTNPGKMTTLQVLAKPDVPNSAIYEYDKIGNVKEYITRDGGDTYEKKFHYPTSMDRNRLYIRYPDEGGDAKDGIIELRRGVQDLSLGESRYAQVRILVNNKSYIKGMAVYSDDMPDGVDVVFNTSKKRGDDEWNVVMKKIKNDPDNPFGSAIKDADQGGQYWYTDEKTGKRKLGLINKRADEGDWTEWSDTLPSQFLSKQSLYMAEKQLNLAKATKQDEFEEYMQINNPTIKKYYLNKFAESCDSAAVDLKAAALPGQKYHVIIPINTLKDDEIYAPQYKPGTKLALIRYPHGGTFEIPRLTVTDKNPMAQKIIGADSIDAVGITKKVADRLSGADFDGDTVMCIPTHDKQGRVRVTSTKELDGLVGFDNKATYGYDTKTVDPDGTEHYFRAGREFKIMKNTNNEMGKISNLITDMTLGGAEDDELAAAVRHSMVVIDAEKHKLDYQKSYIDNNIEALKIRYQNHYDTDGNRTDEGGGASTIISKSKGEKQILKTKGEARVNLPGKSWYDPSKPDGSLIYMTAPDNELYYVKATYTKNGNKNLKTIDGKKVSYDPTSKANRDKYDPVKKKNEKTGKLELDIQTDPDTGEKYVTNKDGSIRYRLEARTSQTTNMADTHDARTLVSGDRHPMELLYADYANSMKDMANKARIEVANTGNLQQNTNAKKVYAKEVKSLEDKLNEALKNRIKERYATRLAAAEINRRVEADPDMKPSDIKKLSQREMSKRRSEVGSVARRDRSIKIDDKEWEAIQAGAISERKLKDILMNSDPDILRQKAMPKPSKALSQAKINRIKAMRDSNCTLSYIAEKMNLSPAQVSNALRGVD